MKHLFPLCLALVFQSALLPAQCLGWQDLRLYGGSGPEYVYGLAVASDGARYICGEFRDTLTLGSTTLVTDDANGSCPFLFKTDSSGNVLWAYTPEYLAASPNLDRFSAVDLDSAGNVYVAATFENIPVVVGSDTLQSQMRDSYILRFDTLGNVIWSTRIGGGNSDLVFDLEVDPDGNILIMGHYNGSMTLDTTTISSLGSRDIFIVKADPNGQILWARSAGASSPDQATSLTVDGQGNVMVNGYFKGTFHFGNDSLVNSSAFNFPFLLKLNGQGDFLWGRTGESGDNVYTSKLTSDAQGNIYYSGEYRDSMEFDGHKVFPLGSADCFVVKYDASGNVQYNVSLGSGSADSPRFLLPGPDSTLWFSWSPGSYNTALGKVTYDQLDASGQSLNQWSGGGGGLTQVVEMAYAPDSSIVGLGNGFPTGANTHLFFQTDSLPFAGGNDMFAIVLDTQSLNAGIQPPATDEICFGDSITLFAQTATGLSYQWYRNGLAIPGATDSLLTVSSSGSYAVSFTSALCSELSDTVSITVHALPQPVILQQGDTLSSSLPGSSFAWYVNDTLIPGAAGSSLTAPQSGDYYFILTDSNGCTGYSDTVHVDLSVGLPGAPEDALRVYPQPASDRVFVELPGEGPAVLGLYDLRGAALLPLRSVDAADRIELRTAGLANGMYILRIERGGRLYSRRLLLTNFP